MSSVQGTPGGYACPTCGHGIESDIESDEVHGVFAKILHNVRDWPLAVKIGALAIPVILELANVVFYGYIANPTPIYKAVWAMIAIIAPVWGMLELTSLINEISAQWSKAFAAQKAEDLVQQAASV